MLTDQDYGDVKDVTSGDILATIAHDLVGSIPKSVTIDTPQKESVRPTSDEK